MKNKKVIWSLLGLVFLLFLALQTFLQIKSYLDDSFQSLKSYGLEQAAQLETRLEYAVQALTLFRRSAGGRTWTSRQLLGLISGHPMFQHLLIADPSGKVVSTTDPTLEGADISSSVVFKEGRSLPKFYPVITLPGTTRAALTVSSPWFFGSEETGIILGEVRLQNVFTETKPLSGPAARQIMFTPHSEEPLWHQGLSHYSSGNTPRIRSLLDVVFLRQTVKTFQPGITGEQSLCYGFYHQKSGLAFWMEAEVDWMTFLGIQKSVYTLLLVLSLGLLAAWALKQDQDHLHRQVLQIEQYIQDITNRKAIEKSPNLDNIDLHLLVRALERLHREHFLTHGPVISNETYFERLIEHSADFIILANFSGQIRYVSKSLTRAFRIHDYDLINHDLVDFLPISREKWFTVVNDLMRGSGVSQYRTNVTFNNVSLVIESRLSFIPGSSDSEPMIVINARDITQQEQLTEALRHREKLATLSQFSGGVVHDFSNLLMNIMGYLALAQMKIEKGDTQILEDINHCQNEILKAREFILSLMAVSQGGVYHYENLKMATLVRDVWSKFAEAAVVSFHLEGETDLQAWVDPAKAASVINELFNNAVFFMGGEGILVAKISKDASVRPGSAEAKQSWVKVSIIDSGPGIPDEVSQKVFDPYVSTRGQGRGLGLAMVYSVMEAMGGWVDVQSRPGLGTSVNLYFKPAREPPQ